MYRQCALIAVHNVLCTATTAVQIHVGKTVQTVVLRLAHMPVQPVVEAIVLIAVICIVPLCIFHDI